MTVTAAPVRLERDGAVAIVTLDRPDVLDRAEGVRAFLAERPAEFEGR